MGGSKGLDEGKKGGRWNKTGDVIWLTEDPVSSNNTAFVFFENAKRMSNSHKNKDGKLNQREVNIGNLKILHFCCQNRMTHLVGRQISKKPVLVVNQDSLSIRK